MVAAAVVALALGLLPGVAVPPAVAAPAAGPACEGVVVVVDATALPAVDASGPGLVACAARDEAAGETSDGIEVLADAGVQVEGTAQWGAAFVCRVEGRPGVSEEIELPGGGVVTEACDRTPSTLAYWSLWTAAEAGSTWTYAQTGVSDLELEPGAALGLAFSVGTDAPAPPALSVADARAGRAGEGWTVRTSPADASPTDGTAAPAPAAQERTDPLLLGAAAALVVVLGAASVVLARRRR